MNEILYYLGFIFGIIFLLISVVLYFILEIRSAGRYLKKKGKKVPAFLENCDKPIFKDSDQDNKRFCQTVVLNEPDHTEDE